MPRKIQGSGSSEDGNWFQRSNSWILRKVFRRAETGKEAMVPVAKVVKPPFVYEELPLRGALAVWKGPPSASAVVCNLSSTTFSSNYNIKAGQDGQISGLGAGVAVKETTKTEGPQIASVTASQFGLKKWTPSLIRDEAFQFDKFFWQRNPIVFEKEMEAGEIFLANLETIRMEMKQLLSEKEKTEEKLSDANNLINSYVTRLSKKEAKCTKLKQANRDWKHEFDALKADYETNLSENRSLRYEMENLKRDHESNVSNVIRQMLPKN